MTFDISEVRTGEGVLQLFVAIDRTGKYAYARLFVKETKAVTAAFPRDLIARVPGSIHTILTDNGLRFANRRRGRNVQVHDLDRVCRDNGIGHRLTKVGHHWAKGQVERVTRTLRASAVKRYHYGHNQLGGHHNRFLDAYNFARRLKPLRGKTPMEEIMDWWTNEPESFVMKPSVLDLGLNSTEYRRFAVPGDSFHDCVPGQSGKGECFAADRLYEVKE